jgi:hypothetical protein
MFIDLTNNISQHPTSAHLRSANQRLALFGQQRSLAVQLPQLVFQAADVSGNLGLGRRQPPILALRLPRRGVGLPPACCLVPVLWRRLQGPEQFCFNRRSNRA